MVSSPRPSRVLGACCALALAAPPLLAQPASPRAVPGAYAITGARIVPVAGPAIAQGTVVVRDGLIVAVGAGVKVPADARVIDGAGLTVYPGFIDAYGALGTAAAARPAGGAPAPFTFAAGPGAPNAAAAPARLVSHPAGIQPEQTMVEALRLDADAVAAAQGAGLTAALAAPTSGILQGQSALLALTGDPATAVLRAPVAQHVGFVPPRTGGYPNSLLGVFSALRQTLLDAQHYRDEQAAYARAPRGMARPQYDATLEALLPALARTQPVVLLANQKREIERALDLAKEFGLRPILAGGAEADQVAARLKAENVPVLLSLNFPRRASAPSPDAEPDPIRVLRERVEAPKVAGRLAQAGVRFAFASANVAWSDFLPNVQRAIDDGLPADAAVRALTIAPAELLGMGDRLGTIEAGKIANLTLVRGTLGERGARVAQLFVDGRPVSVSAPAAAPNAGGAAAAAATGAWTTTVTLDGRNHAVTLTLRQDGERITGSMQGELGSGPIAGTLGPDGALRLTATITLRETSEEATLAGTLDGNAIRGRVTIVGHDPGTFSGTRAGGQPGAARRPQE